MFDKADIACLTSLTYINTFTNFTGLQFILTMNYTDFQYEDLHNTCFIINNV